MTHTNDDGSDSSFQHSFHGNAALGVARLNPGGTEKFQHATCVRGHRLARAVGVQRRLHLGNAAVGRDFRDCIYWG